MQQAVKMTDLLNVTTTKSRLNRQTENLATENAHQAINTVAHFLLIDLNGVDRVNGSS